MSKQLKLWYRNPAEEWTDSLPLGNGRIGAMVFGRVQKERIALNEDTLWSGYPNDKNNPNAAQFLGQAKKLCREKKFGELQDFIEKNMQGDFTESYLPLGDLELYFPNIHEAEVEDYYRDLDLNQAVVHTSFLHRGVRYEREVFVSHPSQMLIMRIWSDSEYAVTLQAGIKCPLRAQIKVDGTQIHVEGVCPSHVEPSYLMSETPIVYEEEEEKRGIGFSTILDVQAVGGKVTKDGEQLFVEGADEVILKLAVRSSYNGFDKLPYLEGKEYKHAVKQDILASQHKDYRQLLQEHVSDYASFYDRVVFSFDKEKEDTIPTDERLQRFVDNQCDERLYEILFQFGRYLMISASREGTQPTNLQGIWNQELRAPWSSNYTLNINTEMNYWPAEICNLSEMHQPLFQFIEELRITGAKTAKLHYNASGSTVHHNSDIWRVANPVGRTCKGSAGYAYWCMSFGWLCQHLFEHYEYTLDEDFLRYKAYPAMKDAALFYLDMLEEDGKGNLILTPSTSPENAFLYEGVPRKVAETTTMTTQIIKEVFQNVVKACEILGIDGELKENVQSHILRLQPYRIGADGGLMEWNEDYEDLDVTHRHISHLYALYPGHEITLEKTPELAEACKRSLEIRGDDGTGWGLGWKINTWARLRDGDHALKLINRQLQLVDTQEVDYGGRGGTYRNMFDAHPPFQIDGNFGVTAGIAQLFLQSYENQIFLLPALPSTWKNVSMKGLCAVSGVVADIIVEDGKLKQTILTAKCDMVTPLQVYYGDKRHTLQLAAGEHYELHF